MEKAALKVMTEEDAIRERLGQESEEINRRIVTLGDRIWTISEDICNFFNDRSVFLDRDDSKVYCDIIIESAEEIKKRIDRLDEISDEWPRSSVWENKNLIKEVSHE